MNSNSTHQAVRNVLAAALLLAPLAGCAQKLAELPMVSMTTTEPPAKSAKKAGKATGKYCIGDKPKATKGSVVGLIDEATFAAQATSKADYLSDAVYMKEGGFFSAVCVVVTADALKR